MSALAVFTREGHDLRTLLVDGEPWFVAADVAAALELSNVHSSLALLDPDEKGLHTMETPGGPQQVMAVTEPGLYSMILRSRRPEAKAFKRWVTHEVLPAIRRTGQYVPVPQHAIPQTYAEALAVAAEQAAAREVAEQQVAALAPRAAVADALIDTTGDYSLREAAQVLARDHGIDVGQNRLARELRRVGWIDLGRQPYQRQVDLGRLVRRATSYEHPKTGDRVSASQVRITAKGLSDLHALLTCPESVPLALVGA